MSISKERGYSNPPSQSGGQECPPSDQFLDPFAPIQQHTHRVPHWQQGSVYYFVTWRLADSLPRDKLDRWNEDRTAWIRSHPEPWDAETEIDYHAQFSRAIDEWLDAGEGSCVLRDAMLSLLVADALLHFDGVRYVMDDGCVCNHAEPCPCFLPPIGAVSSRICCEILERIHGAES